MADSAFSSVTTAVECKKCGLFSTGVLKTASREFPKEYLNDQCRYRQRGDHICLTTSVDNCDLIALGWKDKTIKTFISTCSTTLQGQPHKKHRYTSDGTLVTTEVQCPQLVSQYYSASSKIDVHNHMRQGLLNIEAAWVTHTWWHRLVATLFGVIVINAMLAYNFEHSTNPKTVDEFANDLSLSLIFNEFDGHVPENEQRRLSSDSNAELSGESSNMSVPCAVPFNAHLLKSLLSLPLYQDHVGSKEGACRKCSVCSAKGKRNNAHHYCVTCSDISKNSIVAICGHQSERGTDCHATHCQNAL